MDNTIRYFYEQSMLQDLPALTVFIDYLLFEQEVISLEDDISELDLYFKPNNRSRMNKLINEYKGR